MNQRKPRIVLPTVLLVFAVLLGAANLAALLSGARVDFRGGRFGLATEAPRSRTFRPDVFSGVESRSFSKLKSLGLLGEALGVLEGQNARPAGEEGIASAYCGLGEDFFRIGRFEKALYCFVRAESKARDAKTRKNALSRQGACLEELGRPPRTSASQSPPAEPDSPAVARVGGRVISLERLKAEIAGLPGDLPRTVPGDPRAVKAVLRSLVYPRLVYLEALRLGVDRDPEVARKLEENRIRLLVRTLVDHESGVRDDSPSREELERFYRSRSSLFGGSGGEKPRPFSEVREAVLAFHLLERGNEAFSAFLERSPGAGEATIHEEALELLNGPGALRAENQRTKAGDDAG